MYSTVCIYVCMYVMHACMYVCRGVACVNEYTLFIVIYGSVLVSNIGMVVILYVCV